jgi:hypothetical protein
MLVFVSTCLALLAAQDTPVPVPALQLKRLPAQLELHEDGPQEYRFACDYFETNHANEVTGKHRVAANYVRALEGGKVRWRSLEIGSAQSLDAAFPKLEAQAYMQGFSYDGNAGHRMFLPGFFRGFPDDPTATFAKNLVWDTHMLEQFGQSYFEHLELNRPYALPRVSDSSVPLAGMGAFKNRRIELTWIGVSEQSGEPCALIRYEAFFNRFRMAFGASPMDGLSHYWGLIWVSLEDLQIEHATLNEHVSLTIGEGDSATRHSVLRTGELTKLASKQ